MTTAELKGIINNTNPPAKFLYASGEGLHYKGTITAMPGVKTTHVYFLLPFEDVKTNVFSHTMETKSLLQWIL